MTRTFGSHAGLRLIDPGPLPGLVRDSFDRLADQMASLPNTAAITARWSAQTRSTKPGSDVVCLRLDGEYHEEGYPTDGCLLGALFSREGQKHPVSAWMRQHPAMTQALYEWSSERVELHRVLEPLWQLWCQETGQDVISSRGAGSFHVAMTSDLLVFWSLKALPGQPTRYETWIPGSPYTGHASLPVLLHARSRLSGHARIRESLRLSEQSLLIEGMLARHRLPSGAACATGG